MAKKSSPSVAVESVDITPTPKILKVLGNIEFDPWQCIAELVDNSFDEFLDIKRSGVPWTEPFLAEVSLPATTSPSNEQLVAAQDNGRGMTLAEVTDAARAGWGAKDPFSRLGLFGMGFNVATARLGNVTRLLTTRAGDAEWLGVEIDLQRMTVDFTAPVIRRPKSSPGEHGTRVEITQLEHRADWLTRQGNQGRLRETLGGIYAYLIDTEGFRLSVNGVLVKPFRHCVWSEKRSVIRQKEEIPAVIPIDEHLADRAVCHACGTWQDVANRECDECGSDRLEVRERRVWGWLGIQRHLDAKEFGFDFLRNGRKILRFDKSLFEWRDPDDPTGQGDREYPIELAHQGGRIVGEVHLDHAPVNYLKDNFERSDLGWHKAVEIIRGKGPLLPETAKRLGYGANNSPLARLHRGYRRNDPGKNYLMPGNGRTIIDTKDWSKKFRQGDAAYQTDKRWWDAVLHHEKLADEAKKAKEAQKQAEAASLEDPTTEFRSGGQTATMSGNHDVGAPAPAAVGTTGDQQQTESEPRTEAERVEALMSRGNPMAELDGQFGVSGVPGRPIKMTTYQVSGSPLKGPDNKRTPVWLAPVKGGGFAAFVDAGHPHFKEFDDDPADVVLMELAQHLITRAQGTSQTISAVYAALKDRYLSSRSIDQSRLVAQAIDILRDLKPRLQSCVAENPERPWQNVLTTAERDTTKDRITETLRTADYEATVADGRYLLHVPDLVVPRIVEEWPEAFFDKRLFISPYKEVDSPSAKRQVVAAVTGYLNDVAWLASNPVGGSREQRIRARLSLQLLPDEVEPAEA